MDHSPAHMLVVDDDTRQLEALTNTLRTRGYRTTGVASAGAALQLLHGQGFDLLLTDLKLPDMNGVALLQAARAIDPMLVGVLMTGHGTIETAVEALQSGAHDYILKPFTLRALTPVLTRALAVRRLWLEKAALERRVRDRSIELEAMNAELDSFSHSVSHDLRAPLRGVRELATILMESHAATLTPEALALIQEIHRTGQRGETLVTEMLRFARLGREPMTRQRVALGPLVSAVVEEVRASEPDRSPVEVSLEDLPEVSGSPTLLRQVFENLLSNAFKFTRGIDNACILVGSQASGGERVFFVRDNGVGFDMRYADRLFGLFQRMHSQGLFPGTGVGLSVVQRIIARHGGRVWAETTVNRGATFYFTIPEP